MILNKIKNLSWLKRIDHLEIFNTSSWPHKEAVVRLTACLVLIIFLILKIPNLFFQIKMLINTADYYKNADMINSNQNNILFLLNHYLSVAVLGLETLILLLYMIIYLKREAAIENAETLKETVFPFFVASLPFFISISPYTSIPVFIKSIIFLFMLFGFIINITGLITLGSSFAVMVEVRSLKTQGIYRCIRHPIYFSHFITFLGILIFHFSYLTLWLYLIFILGQYKRAKMEEKKIIKKYPDYIFYKKRTGMFFPDPNKK